MSKQTSEVAVSEKAEREADGPIAILGSAYNLTRDQAVSTIKKTVGKDLSSLEELIAFAIICNQHRLNPFTREIYAMKTKSGQVGGVVGVDGWSKLANYHPQFDGVEYDDTFDEKGNLVSITCRIFRKDRGRPCAVTEYLSECRGGTEPWKRWPARMLRHKAFIQCARLAFGFSGIYDQDEVGRIRASEAREADAAGSNGSAKAKPKNVEELKEALNQARKGEAGSVVETTAKPRGAGQVSTATEQSPESNAEPDEGDGSFFEEDTPF